MRAIPLILNSRSGSADAGGVERLAGLYRAAGAEVSPRVAKAGTDITTLAQEAAREHPRLVVAAGGDGTINAVASALVGSETALGVIPCGTLNHFARDVGVPLDQAEAVVATLEGRAREIDVGEVNGHFFLNNSSIGLYPAMVHRRAKQQRRLGRGKWQAMLWAAHTVLRSHPFMDLALELDGKSVARRTPFVFIGNNVYDMQGFDIGRRARLDAGMLSVYVSHRGGRLALLALAVRALCGRLEQSRDFEAATATELRIESRHKRLLVATDGEVTALELPLRYRIRPRALRVMAP
jgi:diacylglycerol kinase family enzyme